MSSRTGENTASGASSEHAAFIQWLNALTCEELLQAMSFEFVCSESVVVGSNSSTSSSSSDEYNLLVEMMELQPPPPTPVHPKGLGYYPRASRYGPQLDHDEVMPQIHPRLFQWTERQSRNIHVNHRKTNHSRPGSQQQQQEQLAPQQPRFDVVARNKKTPWGQSLSQGCTRDQQEADYQILRGTRLSLGLATATLTTSTTSVKNTTTHQKPQHWAIFEVPSASSSSAATPGTTTSAATYATPKNDPRTKQSILRMLRIASRGYFFNVHDSTASSTASIFQPIHSRIPYCAPWLNPTERWFSLSFYLASRFQVALWVSYQQRHRACKCCHESTLPLVPPTQSILEAAMPMAMTRTVKQILQQDQREHFGSNRLLLRDSIVWDLFELGYERRRLRNRRDSPDPLWLLQCLLSPPSPPSNKLQSKDWQSIWKFWSTSPLVEVKSPITQFRKALAPHLQAAIAMAVEKEFLSALEEDSLLIGTEKFASNSTTTINSTAAKKKKTRKKKRASMPPPQQEILPPLEHFSLIPQLGPPHVIIEEESLYHHHQDDSSSTSDAAAPSSSKQQQEYPTTEQSPKRSSTATIYIFPTRSSGPLERNRSVIIALTILEEVMESVFAHAGLTPTTKFEDDHQQEPRKKLGQPVPAPSSLPWNQDAQQPRRQPFRSMGSVAKKKKKKGQDRSRPQERRQRHHGIDQSPNTSGTGKSGTRHPPKNYSGQVSDGSEHSTSRAFDSEWTNGLWQPLADAKTTWPMLASTATGGSSDESIPETRQWAQDKQSAFHRHHSSQSSNLAGSSRDFPMFGVTNTTAENTSNTAPVVEEDGLDGWPFLNRYQARERSILAEFFRSQEDRIDEDEKLMAASTAASIASSTYKDVPTVTDTDDGDKAYPCQDEADVSTTEMHAIAEGDVSMEVHTSRVADVSNSHVKDDPYGDDYDGKDCVLVEVEQDSPRSEPREMNPKVFFNDEKVVLIGEMKHVEHGNDKSPSGSLEPAQNQSSPSPTFSLDCRSPSPEAPLTPPPTLSPILLSLADLKNLKGSNPERLAHSVEPKKTRSYSAALASGSLPSSPVPKNGLTPSWSREDLRIATFRDDHSLRHTGPYHGPQHPRSAERFPALVRPAPIKSLARPIASSKGANLDFRIPSLDSSVRRERQGDSCARSETAVEHEGDQHWQHDIRRVQSSHGLEEPDNNESTTITSALSNRESEDLTHLREERNSFRDMCLTLGAEVAKLKAVLAAQKATAIVPSLDYSDGVNHAMYGPNSFDPNGMAPFFHGIQRGKRLGPMSDAGIHRPGDHESQISEDDVYDVLSKPRVDNVRRLSSSATMVGSDTSVEFNTSNSALQGGPAGVIPVHETVSAHGLQSRLTKDILNFLKATTMQLKKQDAKRATAIERFTRLVISLWPRAQVKLYGSHVAGLCLPSSDLDFVIRLPAVHKNAPALAPGVLEGRNAINESSQKLLARQLKGESWIDPRSIKLIERTVVPVIKVSTKDTRARMLALDISFDSPEHHGLLAIEMVSQTMVELPLIRPLVLVLKQFLLDRGLLTAYTGGISSYCLFLMVARYLQDQPSNIGDCGSLLMGFLDFFGNCFDPRTTGVSVRRKQYFARPNYAVASAHHQASGQPLWTPPHQQHVASPPQVIAGHPGHPDFLRRNSFNDNTNPDAVRRPPRFQPVAPVPHRYVHHSIPRPNNEQRIRPFTFDPLFVEDPLAVGNNVGRNAFRVNQVQRAFSDAHRALVASLEWDINSTGELNDGGDYPLLKCLLKNEDVVFEL
jgi:hypothetical protein